MLKYQLLRCQKSRYCIHIKLVFKKKTKRSSFFMRISSKTLPNPVTNALECKLHSDLSLYHSLFILTRRTQANTTDFGKNGIKYQIVDSLARTSTVRKADVEFCSLESAPISFSRNAGSIPGSNLNSFCIFTLTVKIKTKCLNIHP